ncbi:Conserved_hypothetical protein [Hexamita inflata]|uniref:Uncharacterized protein n=1 Tax=Hexamita inflata TaxID=28002 RepID=A0AA86Q990_9EUKA|nr:Conserved hypothetical protein [Hexamita inflata]
MTAIQIWKNIYDRIKELELSILLNGVTDGAITDRIKQIMKLTNYIQATFDDQYFRKAQPTKTQLQVTRVRQIGALLADMLMFIPESSMRFRRELRETQHEIEQFLVEDANEERANKIQDHQRKLAGMATCLRQDTSMRPNSNTRPLSKSKYKNTSKSPSILNISLSNRPRTPRQERSDQSLRTVNLQMLQEDTNAVISTQVATDTRFIEMEKKMNRLKHADDEEKLQLKFQLMEEQQLRAQLEAASTASRKQKEQCQRQNDQLLHEQTELTDQIALLKNELRLKEVEINKFKQELQRVKSNSASELQSMQIKQEELERQFQEQQKRRFKNQLLEQFGDCDIDSDFKGFRAEIISMSKMNAFQDLELSLNLFKNAVENRFSAKNKSLCEKIETDAKRIQMLERELTAKSQEIQFLRRNYRSADEY